MHFDDVRKIAPVAVSADAGGCEVSTYIEAWLRRGVGGDGFGSATRASSSAAWVEGGHGLVESGSSEYGATFCVRTVRVIWKDDQCTTRGTRMRSVTLRLKTSRRPKRNPY